MTDPGLDFLERLQKQLRRHQQEIADRLAWYAGVASLFAGSPVKVNFGPVPDGYGAIVRRDAEGRIWMTILPDLDLRLERSLFSHETWHPTLWGPPATPEETKRAELFKEAALSGKLNAVLGIDAKTLIQRWEEEEEKRQESEADKGGRLLYKVLFGTDDYIPCDSYVARHSGKH